VSALVRGRLAGALALSARADPSCGSEVTSRSSSSRVLGANLPGAGADRLRTAGDVEPSRLAANLITKGDLDAASHQAAVIRYLRIPSLTQSPAGFWPGPAEARSACASVRPPGSSTGSGGPALAQVGRTGARLQPTAIPTLGGHAETGNPSAPGTSWAATAISETAVSHSY
jgi:hypothetical protein